MHQLVLASKSPRRRELLRTHGFLCAVDSVQVSEIIDKNLNLERAIEQVAWQKAAALVQTGKYPKGQKYLILSADTVVVLGERVLGQPKDVTEAQTFLQDLSGKTHRVISGICLFDLEVDRFWSASDTTWVEFRRLALEDIKAYVQSGEPMDKAGAYAIQGGAASFVQERRGSWSNVVGLPMEKFEEMVKEHGWQLARL